MQNREFKEKIYGELADMVKALGNPHRLEIIDFLAQGTYTVEQIAHQTDMSIANASQHLQVLKRAKLVEITKNRNFVYYQLAGPQVFEAWEKLRSLGFNQLAEVEKLISDFRHSRQTLNPVTCEELLKKIENNNAVVLDVRPHEEYKQGHIAHAISLPNENLTKKLESLPRDREIIAYCRGPLCVMADEAVDLLKKQGYNARKLEEGYPEWEARGYPVSIADR